MMDSGRFAHAMCPDQVALGTSAGNDWFSVPDIQTVQAYNCHV